MRTALLSLPQRQRAAIVLRYYEDLHESEIADLLRCRPATVRSLVARGLEALRTDPRGDDMTDQDVRDFLERMAAEEPVPFLDAAPLTRRARRRAARTVVVGAVGVAAAIAVLFAGVAAIRSTSVPANDPTPTPAPSDDLGIFAPVAGRIVYGDRDGIWGVDPTGPADPETRVQLTPEAGIPLGWSSDGTRLLIMQTIRGEQVVAEGPGTSRLVVLHADGSETQVAERQAWIPGATISPDGSRVVFATYQALYSVDVDGGRPVLLLEGGEDEVYAPTFSPDGAKIAYVVGSGDHSHRVSVMNADGSDAHQILANDTTRGASHVLGLAWSPADDRIAFGNDVDTYTFAPDGSGFTQVLADGTRPYWSPDGSQLAYSPLCLQDEDGCSLAIANSDGSDARVLGFARSGPWHPGGAEIPPAPIPTETPPTPSSRPFTERFDSPLHGLSIGYPSGWRTRAATEPWAHDAVAFGAPGVDVISHPTLQDDVYFAVVSEPLGGTSGSDWVDGDLLPSVGICTEPSSGGRGGGYTLDGAHGWAGSCGSHTAGGHFVTVATATRGYIIYLHVADDRLLQATYDEDWFEAALETVDLHPEDALDSLNPSESQ